VPSRVQRLWPFLAGALLTYPLPYLVVRSSVPDCYRIAFTGPRLTDDLDGFMLEIVDPIHVDLMPRHPSLSSAAIALESLFLAPCCWIDIKLTGWGYRLRSA
jgi:hypothetical protein